MKKIFGIALVALFACTAFGGATISTPVQYTNGTPELSGSGFNSGDNLKAKYPTDFTAPAGPGTSFHHYVYFEDDDGNSTLVSDDILVVAGGTTVSFPFTGDITAGSSDSYDAWATVISGNVVQDSDYSSINWDN
jgi:hypothetical protein